MIQNFALIGAAGYIAPRHMQAIREVGGNLVAALDPSDSVGILDRYFLDCPFFVEFERFDRHAEKLRRQGPDQAIHLVSICSPNYLHDAHVRFALRIGADALCEKPLVLNPWNVDALRVLEVESGRRIHTVLQLRHHPAILALRERVAQAPPDHVFDIDLVYLTSRGRWYDISWKGDVSKSGGIATNIGVHFFDMLLWIFGPLKDVRVHFHDARRIGGELLLARARVRWFLSLERQDLPAEAQARGLPSYRRLTLDGEPVEFSEGFTDLHTEVYRNVLAGRGFGLDDAFPSIELVHRIRHALPTGCEADFLAALAHP